ncbi:hypothetical protein [Sodalinema gerasimenkoae]|uniref:hypothetical protein n=1 Tax=Sodalinema gerasimenkoae TaxID=2862348 RepID=UPI00135B44BB|nr:hypothetical protein [Sodalinema gerasimenkoae]
MVMKRPSQLTQLLWDFYRENPEELQQLKILQQCQVFRFWGAFCIRVQTPAMAQRIHDLIPVVEAPIEALRLAKQVKILVGRRLVASYLVGTDCQDSPVREWQV